MDDSNRLKVAIQKSGRLTDNSLGLLASCGLKYSRGKDQLFGYGENMPLDVLFVRDDDIVDLVQEGVADFGIAGINVVDEHSLGLLERGTTEPLFTREHELDFGRCRLSIAVPAQEGYAGPESLQGKRIATTYPRILKRWLVEHKVDARIVTLSGAVEIAPRLGRADVICDLVSTGSTLVANGLREVQSVLQSQAIFMRTSVPMSAAKAEWAGKIMSRIAGVQAVKDSKYVMLHAPGHALEQIKKLLPGSESPTIIPLDASGTRFVVHAVCTENVFWETLESLKAAGASAVVVLPVEKMLP